MPLWSLVCGEELLAPLAKLAFVVFNQYWLWFVRFLIQFWENTGPISNITLNVNVYYCIVDIVMWIKCMFLNLTSVWDLFIAVPRFMESSARERRRARRSCDRHAARSSGAKCGAGSMCACLLRQCALILTLKCDLSVDMRQGVIE